MRFLRLSVALLILLVFSRLFISCSGWPDSEEELEKMKQADRDFSSLSEKKGMIHAFSVYAAEDAVLLRPGRMPVCGKKELEGFLSKIDDTKFSLVWQPLDGKVAESGDLGYTFGTYLLSAGDEKSEGTYVSVWKKTEDNAWKYVLDSGNEGLGKKSD